MSTLAGGFPDWQRITQWFGTALDQATGYALGAGAKQVGPLNVRNFASLVICVRPVGGNVIVTVDQQVPSGPAGLKVSTSFTVNAGNVSFQSIVLLAGAATVTFQGTAGGETLDYAIVPSNVNTNTEVSTLAQLRFQLNDVAVANETAIDFETGGHVTWTLVDDPGNTRVKVSAAVAGIDDAAIAAGAAIAISKLAGYPANAVKILHGDGSWGANVTVDDANYKIAFGADSPVCNLYRLSASRLGTDGTFYAGVSSGNLVLNGDSGTSGSRYVSIANAATVPTTNPVGGGQLYANGGALYWRGSGGTVTMIAAA